MFVAKFSVQMRAALIAVALAGLVSPVHAQKKPSPAALALSLEILSLKGADRMYAPLIPGIITNVKNTFLQTNVSLSKELDEVALKLAREYNPRTAELNTYAAQVYASSFTEQELSQIVAFYKSPLGKKVIQLEPKILEQSMGNADKWARGMEQEILNRFRAEMKKKGHDL